LPHPTIKMSPEIPPQSTEIFRRSRINEHGHTYYAYRHWLTDEEAGREALSRSPEFRREDLEEMTVQELELVEIDIIRDFLKRPDTQEAIEQGRMTLGIIKPAVNEGVNFPKNIHSDHHSARYIVERFIEPAWIPEGILVQFAVPLSPEQAQKLYVEHQGKKFFEDLIDYISSGPVTFLLLYDESGRAVERWRHIMGATDPKQADFESIRGTHAPSLEHNLVHGSDSRESAAQEIGLFVEILEDWHDFLQSK